MVAKRKAKDLPEARRANPYAELSRAELDAALAEIEARIASSGEGEELTALRKQILEGYLWLMVREGKASWGGGKPAGSANPVRLTPGPSIAEMVSEGRL